MLVLRAIVAVPLRTLGPTTDRQTYDACIDRRDYRIEAEKARPSTRTSVGLSVLASSLSSSAGKHLGSGKDPDGNNSLTLERARCWQDGCFSAVVGVSLAKGNAR